MKDGNPFGFKDHRPFSGFSDELVYGITPTGETVHISQVVRGLRCDCRCPACDRPLVAKKGTKQLHHFAHYNRAVTCSNVAETNAHIWAKEVLEREKKLTIPEIVAEHEGHREIVSPARIYEFVHARLEKRIDTIVPDVVLVTANGAQLIVEVRVTHACEMAKLEKLQNDGLSAVEIDLRRFRTSTDREAVEDALLSSAPREWLSNAKQTKFDDRLRDRLASEAALKAKEAEDRAKRIAAREAEKIRRAQEEVDRAANKLIGAVRASNLRQHLITDDVEAVVDAFVEAPWSDYQTIGFSVHPYVWQAELVTTFLTYPNALDYQCFDEITTGLALRTVSHHLLPAFRCQITEPMRRKLRDQWPSHRTPAEAVEAFLDGLTGSGYLWASRRGAYTVSEEYADQLSESERRRLEYERRSEDIRRRVSAILLRLPQAEHSSFDIEQWLVTRIKGQNVAPDTLCRRGDGTFRSFERALKTVELLCEGGPVAEELLGLPVAGEVARARIREREKLVKAAARRRSSLTEAAQAALGEEADAWLSGPSEEDDELTRIDQAGFDDLSYQRTRSMLAKAAAARQLKTRARQEAILRQNELREAGAKIYDEDRLDLFLRALHPNLGKSPLEHCVDLRTLRECLALLPRARQSKFR